MQESLTQDILASHSRVLDIVKTESLNLRDKYSDDRRTEISAVSGEVDIEDLIPEEECVLTKTVNGYIKRLPADTYSVQHRGGRGIMGMQTREDDFVESMFVCNSHDFIMMFTTFGRMYKLKAYEIPEGSRTSKGMNIINILPLMPEEKITIVLPASELDEEKFITMVTSKGTIKRTKVSEFRNTRKSGIIAINIDDDDEVIGMIAYDPTAEDAQAHSLLVVSENGYGKRSDFDEYRKTNRNPNPNQTHEFVYIFIRNNVYLEIKLNPHRRQK